MNGALISDPPKVFLYEVDAADLLVSVGDTWLNFAQENQAQDLVEKAVLGESIWTYFSGYQVQEIYGSLFRRVRVSQREITLPFRCDSASQRRFMELRMQPAAAKGIQLESKLVLAEAVMLFDHQAKRSKQFVVVCSWCKKIRAEDHWIEVEVAVEALGLFDALKFPQLSHGICGPCKEVALGKSHVGS